jgi:GTP pyrophosphokinase
MVNGKMADFNTPLHDGDIVEVITNKNVSPNTDRLNKMHTSHARGKLRSFLNKKIKQAKSRVEGKSPTLPATKS